MGFFRLVGDQHQGHQALTRRTFMSSWTSSSMSTMWRETHWQGQAGQSVWGVQMWPSTTATVSSKPYATCLVLLCARLGAIAPCDLWFQSRMTDYNRFEGAGLATLLRFEMPRTSKGPVWQRHCLTGVLSDERGVDKTKPDNMFGETKHLFGLLSLTLVCRSLLSTLIVTWLNVCSVWLRPMDWQDTLFQNVILKLFNVHVLPRSVS